ncbi:MAG: hypothetical protein ACXABY_03985 [Candidatus Thorarchaeota archaeon]
MANINDDVHSTASQDISISDYYQFIFFEERTYLHRFRTINLCRVVFDKFSDIFPEWESDQDGGILGRTYVQGLMIDTLCQLIEDIGIFYTLFYEERLGSCEHKNEEERNTESPEDQWYEFHNSLSDWVNTFYQNTRKLDMAFLRDIFQYLRDSPNSDIRFRKFCKKFIQNLEDIATFRKEFHSLYTAKKHGYRCLLRVMEYVAVPPGSDEATYGGYVWRNAKGKDRSSLLDIYDCTKLVDIAEKSKFVMDSLIKNYRLAQKKLRG